MVPNSMGSNSAEHSVRPYHAVPIPSDRVSFSASSGAHTTVEPVATLRPFARGLAVREGQSVELRGPLALTVAG